MLNICLVLKLEDKLIVYLKIEIFINRPVDVKRIGKVANA